MNGNAFLISDTLFDEAVPTTAPFFVVLKMSPSLCMDMLSEEYHKLRQMW